MGGIRSNLSPTAPLGTAPETQDDEGQESGLGNFCAGSRVIVRCRRSVAFIDGVSAPDRTQWEGPFIRIRPAFGGQPKRSKGTLADSSTPYATFGGALAPFGNQAPYYDIDAFGQSAIYLPFDASLSILTVRSAAAIWDVWEIGADDAAPPQYRQTFTQSRWARDGQVRRVTVPFGAQEMALIGQPADAAVIAEQEDLGKTVGLGSTIVPIDMFGANGSAGMRIPCGAFRTIQLTAPAGDVLGVAFYITL